MLGAHTPVRPCQMDLQLAAQCEVAALQPGCSGEAGAASAACLSAAAALRQGVASALDSLTAQALLRHAAGHELPKAGAAPLTVKTLMAQLIRFRATALRGKAVIACLLGGWLDK